MSSVSVGKVPQLGNAKGHGNMEWRAKWNGTLDERAGGLQSSGISLKFSGPLALFQCQTFWLKSSA